jgi:hypothetical protein
VVRQFILKRIPSKPANSDTDLGFAHKFAIVHDAMQETGKHQTHCRFGVDTGPPVIRALTIRNGIPQPAEVQNRIHSFENMIIGDQLLKCPSHKQLTMPTILRSQHQIDSSNLFPAMWRNERLFKQSRGTFLPQCFLPRPQR